MKWRERNHRSRHFIRIILLVGVYQQYHDFSNYLYFVNVSQMVLDLEQD